MQGRTALPLIFETHATSLDNEAALASGWFDVDLSPAGEQQARELGERRRDEPPAAVFCSDLRRASRTAEIAFGDTGVSIVRDPRLREVNYGALTRSPSSTIEASRVRYIRDPFPNGESYEHVTERVRSFLTDIARANGERPVLVIGHRATFYALEHLLTGAELIDIVAAPWSWRPGWEYELTPPSA